MTKDKNKITLFLLGVSGVLFSGYLSGVKFFSSTCAFNESCPYFLGYPACYFGFIMFLVIAIVSTYLLYSKKDQKQGIKIIFLVSLVGILFAGRFTFEEIPLIFKQGFTAYALGLPTCALGLIFYILVFAVSFYEMQKNKEAL